MLASCSHSHNLFNTFKVLLVLAAVYIYIISTLTLFYFISSIAMLLSIQVASNSKKTLSCLFSPEWLASVSDDMWVHVQDCLNDTTV